MFNELFQSLHEAVKKRNTPDNYVIDGKDSEDVIHRGYIDASFPLRYDFIPDGRGIKNSGIHAYAFDNDGIKGVVEIHHKYSPKESGHETHSRVSFEMTNGRRPKDIQIHRTILPAILHHMKSHSPDIVEFGPSVKFSDDLIRRLGKKFDSYEKTSEEGTTRIAKRKLDQRTSRVVQHIKKRLNRNKEQ
jgi:hypothetical protein